MHEKEIKYQENEKQYDKEPFSIINWTSGLTFHDGEAHQLLAHQATSKG